MRISTPFLESRQQVLGLGCAVLGNAIWALYPFFWILILHVPVFEVLAHRMVWSLVVILLLLPFVDGLTALKRVFRDMRLLGFLLLNALLIGCNWSVYIYSIAVGRVIEASLGYYMSPLLATFCAMLFLGERLRRLQFLAVGLILAGVSVSLLFYGQIPLLGIAMGVTFALYSTIRSKIRLPSLSCLCIEVIPAVGVALGYLVWIDGGTMPVRSLSEWLLIMCAGPITVLPLLLHGFAVNRAPLVPVALLFYIVPSGLFVISIWVFNEPFSEASALVFGCVWSGVALYALQGLLDRRQARH